MTRSKYQPQANYTEGKLRPQAKYRAKRKYHEVNTGDMIFPIPFIIEYISKDITLLPGDIISTGTPGATPLKNGDIIECHIEGFQSLFNHVVDLKLEKERQNEFGA